MQKVKGVKVTPKVKIVKRKILHKKDTFTIIAMNYVQEQLKTFDYKVMEDFSFQLKTAGKLLCLAMGSY